MTDEPIGTETPAEEVAEGEPDDSREDVVVHEVDPPGTNQGPLTASRAFALEPRRFG